MKKTYLFFTVATVVFLFTSCNKGDEKTDYSAIVDFEEAVLLTQTGGNSVFYDNILWGKEKAKKVDGADNSVFDGILYSEDGLGFGSYYNDMKNVWGEGTIYDTYSGFAISSNHSEDSDADFKKQFYAYGSGKGKFAVAYIGGNMDGVKYNAPTIEFDSAKTIVSARIANTSYTYTYCASNPKGAKDEVDISYKLIATGYVGEVEKGIIKFTLAQGSDVLNDWKAVSFSSLGEVDRVVFSFESNDIGDYGNNIPAYFCIDDIKIK